MSNNLRTRNGLPFNFVNGIKVRGMDIESLIPGIEGIPEAGSKYQFAGNGSNKVFTLPVTPYNKDAVDVYVKQLYVHPDDYTLVGDTITLTEAPPAVVAGETYNVVVKVSLTTLNGYVNASRVSFEGENLDDILEKSKPIANYAALRAYTGGATQVRITDPGIAGFFYYDASDTTSVDNGGTIIVSNIGKRWKRSCSEAANVKWFGAIGNGIRNDTQEIQNAINSCTTLYIPEGNYIISGLTINKNNFKLYGEGESRTFFTMDNTAAIAIALGSSTYVSGVDIRNIRIEGNLNNLGGISLGTAVNYAGRIKLYDLFILGFMNTDASSGYAVRLNSNQNTDIYNVFTNDCHYGIYRANGGYSTSTKISGKNSYFGRNQTHGIYIDGQCDDIEVSDAVVEGCLGAGIYVTSNAATLAGPGRGTRIIINSVYFEENNKNGLSAANAIVIKGNSTGYAQHTVDVSQCQFAEDPSSPIGSKKIYFDRVYGYVTKNKVIPGQIETTATCIVRFENNRFPNAGNYATQYRALLGEISVTDTSPWASSTVLNQINYVNSITFPETSRPVNDPNTLDDYLEGAWTPTASGFGGTVTSVSGTYTKIGNRVFFEIVLQGTNLSSTWSTSILSLPFTVANRSTAAVLNASGGANLGLGYITYFSGSHHINMPTFSSIASPIIFISGHYVTAQ